MKKPIIDDESLKTRITSDSSELPWAIRRRPLPSERLSHNCHVYSLVVPTLADYSSLVPFTLDELVAAANAILRVRPSLQIQSRTVRFYISSGLLPPPSGGPKFARYGMEHLRRIVSIRQWLEQGMSLEQAGEAIARGEHGGVPETHQRRQSPRMQQAPAPQSQPIRGPSERTVRRVQLTDDVVLEIASEADFARELRQAALALHELLQTL